MQRAAVFALSNLYGFAEEFPGQLSTVARYPRIHNAHRQTGVIAPQHAAPAADPSTSNPHPVCSSTTLRALLHGYPSRHALHRCGRRPRERTPSDGAGSGRAALAGVFTEVSSGGMRECCRAVTIPRPCRNDRTSQGCHARSALHGTAPQRCHAALQTVQFTDRCQTITTGPT